MRGIGYTLSALSLTFGSTLGHATTLRTDLAATGQLNGSNFVGATADIATVYSPKGPTFALRDLELSIDWDQSGAPTFNSIRGLIDFAPYSFTLNGGTLAGTAKVTQQHAVYEFGQNGTLSWDASTRTLSLGQPLNYSTIDSQINNNQTSDASARWAADNGAVTSTCVGSSRICGAWSQHFIARPDLEFFFLSMTFNESFSDFEGYAVSGDVGGALPLGKSGNIWSSYSFTSVPEPASLGLAAAGLFALRSFRRR